MLDATGIKVSGEGEWKVKIHGKTKRRKWIKVHIAVDEKTQEILQLEITDGHTPRLQGRARTKCSAAAEVYLADGGYDTKTCRKAIKEKGARALVSPRRSAKWDPKQKARKQVINEKNKEASSLEKRIEKIEKTSLELEQKLIKYDSRFDEIFKKFEKLNEKVLKLEQSSYNGTVSSSFGYLE